MVASALIGVPGLLGTRVAESVLYNEMWWGTFGWLYAIYAIVMVVITISLQLYFWSKSTSMGKALLKMKVVDKDSYEPVGFWKMVLRELIIKHVSGICFGLGYLWILIDSQTHQSWHDKILNTLVVEK